MCLFDVVVALDVKKIEKKCLFLYFFNAIQHLPIFSLLLPISFIPDPSDIFADILMRMAELFIASMIFNVQCAFLTVFCS